MGLEEYAEIIKKEVEKRLGEGFRAECRSIRKNNGINRLGLLLRKDGEHVVPYLYLEEYMEELHTGRKTLSQIADELLRIWEAQRKERNGQEFIFEYEAVREHIVFRLVHGERNEDLLHEVPHFRFLDLAVTFHVVMLKEKEEVGMFLIRNGHLELWNVTAEEIRRRAYENTPKLFPAIVRSMEEILNAAEGIPAPWNTSDPQEEPDIPALPMYVLTNETGLNGASVIFYPSILMELAGRLDSDLYLLPSSIHEFIAVPSRDGFTPALLKEMVSEVNESQVPDEEFLSGEVYLYNRSRGEVRNALSAAFKTTEVTGPGSDGSA